MKHRELALLIMVLLLLSLTACGHHHEYGEWVVEAEANCEEDGMEVRSCECGKEETKDIPALGHENGEWVVDIEPTCSEMGKKHLSCSVCGEIIKEEVIEATGHVDGKWVIDTEPTCTKEGKKHFVCEICNATTKTEIIAATGHTDGDWVVDIDATCVETGSKHLNCAVCGMAFKTETIAEKGHTEGEWIIDVDATCTKTGSRHLTCMVCEATVISEEIAPKGHKDGSWVVDVAATCAENGEQHLACADCGVTIRTETIAATGHTEGKWVTDVDATCTQNGSKHLACADCDVTIRTEAIAATGHTEGKWVTDASATCTKNGSKHLECSVCKANLKTETIAATGEHSYSSEVTSKASCVSEGIVTYTCSGCGDVYTETFSCETYTATEIYDNYVNSVGEVITYDRSGYEYMLGTCFVYSSDGVVITNYHVIDKAYYADVTIGGVTYEVQQVLAYDEMIDIAVLKVSANNLIPVKLCEQSHKVGAVVYALGSSKGLTATFSDGMITYSNRVIDGVSYTQHDAPISSGNSGGPLINEYGEVIGINTWTVRDSQNLNFAINVSELSNLHYDSPLTLAEFYHKECDPFTNMKDYIMAYGSYSSDTDAYVLIMDTDYSSDYTTEYTRAAYYYVSNDIITLDFVINNGENWVYFEIDENISGAYEWEYFDEDDYVMSGMLYASTYDDNTLLGYDYNNINNAELRSSVRSLASSMIDVLCSWINVDFEEAGITAGDLHFYNYDY